VDNEQDGLPERRVNVNQVVAFNMARWRKAAGLTQEELGERLGWSNTAVSAAERSVDGKRVRQFDADDLTSIAQALGMPLIAMFLPPGDDSVSVRYLIGDDPDAPGMANLFALLLLDAAEPLDGAWTEALEVAVARYTDPDLGAELLARLEDITSEERRAIRLERLRWQRDALRAVLADLDSITEAMEEES
jgi:transcriptional regulator with XRE-family HTH domain